MNEANPNDSQKRVNLKDAARFWERQRAWYNGVLVSVVVLWVMVTWPHFRPAMTLVALGKMTVLALLANLCYCAGYAMEGFIQPIVPQAHWRRLRWVVWVAGMLLAILLSNYWIADEIYPDFNQKQGAVMLGAGEIFRGGATTASNMNFPAPVAVVGFLAGCIGLFVAAAAGLIFWFARKPRFARIAGTAIGVGAVIYFGMLLGFSASSHSNTLARGQEKYFCEIDCHLAYSVVDVQMQGEGAVNNYVITLRTRFDETTTSSERPKDAALTPSPREVRVVDRTGQEYAVVSSAGTSLMTPLKPGESYTTALEFQVPRDAEGLRLLIRTVPGWPDRFVIGDENSWGHEKTYLAL